MIAELKVDVATMDPNNTLQPQLLQEEERYSKSNKCQRALPVDENEYLLVTEPEIQRHDPSIGKNDYMNVTALSQSGVPKPGGDGVIYTPQ